MVKHTDSFNMDTREATIAIVAKRQRNVKHNSEYSMSMLLEQRDTCINII